MYDIDPANAIGRLKSGRNLRGRRRAAAARLAMWRESEALKLDRPRQWILRDAVLIDIAHRLPQNRDQLGRITDIPPKVVKRSGDRILEAVAASADDNHDYRPPGPPDEDQKALLEENAGNRNELCLGPGHCRRDDCVQEGIVRRDLSVAAASPGYSTGWRRDLIGNGSRSALIRAPQSAGRRPRRSRRRRRRSSGDLACDRTRPRALYSRDRHRAGY